MTIHEVLRYLPHRYPFLLVDRVTECREGEHLRAYKNVSYNEPFFTGHFPGRPVFPGVLILEAMAQATGLLAFRTEGIEAQDNTLYLFVGIDKARFKRQVEPGDRLDLEVDLQRRARGMWRFSCSARVDTEVACEADLMCTMREVEP